jgi:hypothetical protein
MTRLKRPPYAAALERMRRSGRDTPCVHVVFGGDWARWLGRSPCSLRRVVPPPHPALALKRRDYAAGIYDFSAVTGLWVALLDAEHMAGEEDAASFWALVGELGRHAARVGIWSYAFDRAVFADEIAFAQRDWSAARDASRNHGWPSWWSDDIDRKHAERRLTWLQAGIERELERA